jgi:DNA mismatch repair protein MutS
MAGMPPSLIERANEILLQLETKHVEEDGNAKSELPLASQGMSESIGRKVKGLSLPKMQLSIFDAHSETFDEIRQLLEGMDINRLTPVEALLKLQEIKSKLK